MSDLLYQILQQIYHLLIIREKCFEKGLDEKIILLWATLTQNVPFLA